MTKATSKFTWEPGDLTLVKRGKTGVKVSREVGEKRSLIAGKRDRSPITPKRGRPLGSKNKPKAIEDRKMAIAAKRGRGRPLGSKNKPKNVDAIEVRKATVAKRSVAPEVNVKRGRPFGSKNRPKVMERQVSIAAKKNRHGDIQVTFPKEIWNAMSGATL